MRLSYLAAAAMLGLFALGIAGAQIKKPQPITPCDSGGAWTNPKTMDYSGTVVHAAGSLIPMSAKPGYGYLYKERRAMNMICFNDALSKTCHLAIAILMCVTQKDGTRLQLEAEVNEFPIEAWSDEQIVAVSYDRQSTLTIYPKQKRVVFHDYHVLEAEGKVVAGDITDYELK